MDTCLIIVPVLRRAHRVEPLLESIEAATPEPHHILFVCTPEDIEEQRAIEKAGRELICTPEAHAHGDYATKVNLAYRATWEPLMFLAADDLTFHLGWLTAAKALLSETVQVVGTNDAGNRRTFRGEHSTHSLVTRAYVDKYGTIDEAGKVLHEGYWHEFVDDEFIQTAKARGAYAHAPDSVVEHLHPLWGKAPTDALYEEHSQRMIVGRRLYNRRRHLWEC